MFVDTSHHPTELIANFGSQTIGGSKRIMTDELEVEEEFDPSILGLTPVESSESAAAADEPKPAEPSTVSFPLVQPVTPVTAASNTRFTALDLLRSISGSYASANWTPDGHSPARSLPSLSDGDKSQNLAYNGKQNNPNSPPLAVHELQARDFAATPGSPCNQLAKIALHSGGEPTAFDMERTESYESTIPSTNGISPPRSRSHITLVRIRLPGRRHYRTKVKVQRVSLPAAIHDTVTSEDDGGLTSDAPSYPEPATQFQRDLLSVYGHEALEKLEYQAKLDSTSGNQVPSVIRDLFPALADPMSAIRIANVFRRRLELPTLAYTQKLDKLALRRAIARMRDSLYIEMAAAMTLPLAPPPSEETGDEANGNAKQTVTMTPSSLHIMATRMPSVFPAEKTLLKAFLADDFRQAYGEKQGKVVWQGGVGRLRGKGEGGYKGDLDASGLCHIYVDHSNILYGLLHHLAVKPSDALPPRHLRTLSLPCLSLLLRRGRPTPPGSLHLVASSPLHQNLDPLVRLGWEVSVLKRVEMYEDEVEDPTSMHVTAKPQSRISGASDMGLRRYREQGVDEILHLKILQVLNSKGPKAEKGSTLVLATGDARGGQFNRDGFPGAVREALKRGWSVELWSFSAGLSRAWKEAARRERWTENGKFTIWSLDDWAEQLVEVATDVEE
ncbi:hypothetical protein IAR55_000062 [Kwoniella newhampshirensis]|uniref:NYN domain-containing protein n=1 Tax=Kwoniella newhampshirensis TaxID=1651941 RepID=A0AAW0Z5N9_9TREE